MRKIPEGATYKNRPAGVVPLNMSVDREAAQILRASAPTSKALGHLVSRLAHEMRARDEERARRLQEAVAHRD